MCYGFWKTPLSDFQKILGGCKATRWRFPREFSLPHCFHPLYSCISEPNLESICCIYEYIPWNVDQGYILKNWLGYIPNPVAVYDMTISQTWHKPKMLASGPQTAEKCWAGEVEISDQNHLQICNKDRVFLLWHPKRSSFPRARASPRT